MELLYADDLVVITETEDDLTNEWKDNVENTYMRINMNKTKIMISWQHQKLMQKAANIHPLSASSIYYDP